MALVGAVAVAGLAACGGSSGGQRAASARVPATPTARAVASGRAGSNADTQAVLAANKRTAAARTARVAMVEEVRQAGATQPVEYTVDGVIDLASGGLRGIETVPGARLDLLQLGTVEYARPLTTGPTALAPGKTWIRIDLKKTVSGLSAGGGGSLGSGSLTQTFGELGRAGVSATKVGPDTVRGQPATHYKVVLDLGRPAGATPASGTTVAPGTTAAPADRQQPLDIWIDAQGRITQTRQAMTMTVSTTGQSQRVSYDATITFYDFGTAAPDLTPPPADQVEDSSLLTKGQGQPA